MRAPELARIRRGPVRRATRPPPQPRRRPRTCRPRRRRDCERRAACADDLAAIDRALAGRRVERRRHDAVLEVVRRRYFAEREIREHRLVVGRPRRRRRDRASAGLGAERPRDRAVVVVPGVGHGVTSSARSAARSFCMPIRMRYFTVPSGSSSSPSDLAVREPVEVRHLDRHALRLRGARPAQPRTACSASCASSTRAGSSTIGDGLRAPPPRAGAAATPRAHALDRPAVGHREQERAQRAAARVEPLGSLPETHEHVLHDLLGQRLVRRAPGARDRAPPGRALGRPRATPPSSPATRRARELAIAGVVGHARRHLPGSSSDGRPLTVRCAVRMYEHREARRSMQDGRRRSAGEPGTGRCGEGRTGPDAAGQGPRQSRVVGTSTVLHPTRAAAGLESALDAGRREPTRENDRDAHHLPRPRRLLRGDPGRLGAVRPVVHARVLRVVVPVPAQRRARSRARSRRPTTSTSRTCTATTSIPSGSRRHVDKRARVLLPEFGDRPPRSASCGALGFTRLRAHRSTASRSTSTGSA